MIFNVLGPVGVESACGRPPSVLTPQVRAVLIGLLRRPGQYVLFDRLAEHIWIAPPTSASANLRTHVAALRKDLNSCVPGLGRQLETRRGGAGGTTAYRLAIDPSEVDATAFYGLVSQGQDEIRALRPVAAAQKLKNALALWKGPIGEDMPDTELLRSWTAHLTELRHAAIENLAEAQLLLNDSTWIFANILPHLAENPLRERPVGILMHALHLAGDRHGSLNIYHDYRRRLFETLGVDPSLGLQKLYVSMLDARSSQLEPSMA